MFKLKVSVMLFFIRLVQQLIYCNFCLSDECFEWTRLKK